jgi:transcriptional regulator with XRE-family HTH domain
LVDAAHIDALKSALGQRLADLRKVVGATQQDVARRGLVHRSYVSHAERGQQIPERPFWLAADSFLNADGCLIAAYDELADAICEARQVELNALRKRHVYDERSLRTTGVGPVWENSDEQEVLELARRVAASDVSGETLDRLERVVDEAATRYSKTSPAELLDPVRHHVAYVNHLLDARKTIEQHRRLLV